MTPKKAHTDFLVTLGVCVRNAEQTIGAALDSIAKQDFEHRLMELVIVDDGSQDRTLAVVKDVTRSLDINTRIHSQAWKGVAYSRQFVVENAYGKYIVWVDADNVVPSSFVRKHVEFMEHNPKIGIASGQEMFPDDSLNYSLAARLQSMRALAARLRNTASVVDVGGSISRLEAINDVGGFDTGNKAAAEDVDVANKILKTRWKRSLSPAEYVHMHRNTWKDLWDEFFWFGLGSHYVFRKQKEHSDPTTLPLVAMVPGLRDAFCVYHVLHQKAAFLLPVLYFFTKMAWWSGYATASLRAV